MKKEFEKSSLQSEEVDLIGVWRDRTLKLGRGRTNEERDSSLVSLACLVLQAYYLAWPIVINDQSKLTLFGFPMMQ